MLSWAEELGESSTAGGTPPTLPTDCLGSFTCLGIGSSTWGLGFKSHPKDLKVCTVGQVQHFLPEILSPQVLDRPGFEPLPKKHVVVI